MYMIPLNTSGHKNFKCVEKLFFTIYILHTYVYGTIQNYTYFLVNKLKQFILFHI